MSALRSNLVPLMALGLLGWAIPAPAQGLTADVDPPVIEHIEDTTTVVMIAPTNTMQGTRGLPETYSAEALGEGRFVVGLYGPWYRQERPYAGAPNENADIFTGTATMAYGISRQWDVFASLTAYGSNNYNSPNAAGLGTLGGGVQATLPFSPSAPIRMAAQFGAYNGLSENQINENFADGYNYFETRTGIDFRGNLIQSLVFGSEGAAFKMHFNEGLATSVEDNTPDLLLLAMGLQMNLPRAAVGMEIHSRTDIRDIALNTDPLWLTPSVQLRTGYNLNLSLGGDISLSQERADSRVRALEPYRLFGGLAFTFDMHAEKRRLEKMEALRASRERAALKAQAIAMKRKAYEDSVYAANANERITNITVQNEAMTAEQAALSEKARQDSLALAEANRRLAEEKSKRSDLENQLLNTGMLVMDAVYFETGKAEISINSKPYLNMLAKMLVKYPKLNIEVAGHTDNVGSDSYNMGLSQARAASVMGYLVGQAPELGSRLTARGYGETMAKADNTSAEGRKLNRRTELQVLNKEMLREYNEPISAVPTGSTPAGGTQAGSRDVSPAAPEASPSPSSPMPKSDDRDPGTW